MSEHSNGFWEQIRQLCKQKKTIHTLDRCVANTLSDADDGGLIATSSQTNRSRRIYRSSLEKLWETSKESLGAEIRGNWDAIEAAIVGHLPNIEYALRPMRLFFVDPPTHELGTSKLRSDAEPSVIPKEADEVGEVRHEKETKADKPSPVSDLDPNWGHFPKLGDSAASDTEVKILIADDDPIWLEVKSLVDEAGAFFKLIRAVRRVQWREVDFERYYQGLLATYCHFLVLKDELCKTVEGRAH